MENNWDNALNSLSKINVFSYPNNDPVTIRGVTDDLKCIGVGTDAAVFQHADAPNYAFKVYANDKVDKIKVEAKAYQTLGDSAFFPTCFAASDKYLVLSYEEGPTLFDCLLQGIHIPKTIINEVEEAREYIRSKGLNPRDIHLKNIILQNGKVKIIDVSEYALPGNDLRWEYLKKGYEQYYHLIDGNSVPLWLIETVRRWYNQQRKSAFSYDDFTKAILKLFHLK